MNLFHWLDLGFLYFHTGLILFNALGWIWVQTRRWNLYTLLATAGSWFILGIWYGWGYCFCTDWHWDVRRQLGDTDLPRSYMTFLVETWTGIQPDPFWVDAITLLGFLMALAISIYMNMQSNSPQASAGNINPGE